MRSLLPAFAFVLLASPALASSIEPISGSAGTVTSVRTITCADCPPLKEKPKGETYFVDSIEPGTQKVEIREANGERMIHRTEAWMGGSPVLFVSKAPEETVKAADVAPAENTVGEIAPVAIDTEARTGAVNADMAASREFDPSAFELRVN